MPDTNLHQALDDSLHFGSTDDAVQLLCVFLRHLADNETLLPAFKDALSADPNLIQPWQIEEATSFLETIADHRAHCR